MKRILSALVAVLGVSFLLGDAPFDAPRASGFTAPGRVTAYSTQAGFNTQGEVYVTSYGAKCDGKIAYNGITTTNTSPVISSGQQWTFGQSDVGATITITTPAPQNNNTNPTAFTSKILSVQNGNATLAAPVTFSNAGGAAARWYHTVDTVAIQNAFNALSASGGGAVVFPGGVCVTGQITFYTGTTIRGQNPQGSIVMLANGSNSDLFEGYQFSSLTGTNSAYGITAWGLKDIQLDGNRGANTGSNSGTIGTGTGDGIRVYGSMPSMFNVVVDYFAADGIYTEWSNTAGSPYNSPAGMESAFAQVRIDYNAGYGWFYDGPHDGTIDHMWLVGNGNAGMYVVSSNNAAPVTMIAVHSYGNGGQGGLDAAASNVNCSACDFEDNARIQGQGYTFTDSNFGTLVLGISGGGTVYNLNMINTTVGTLNNSLGMGSGFDDVWVGGSIGSITGSYGAEQSVGTFGLKNQLAAGTLFISNGASYDLGFNQSGGSVFTITNTGTTQATNSSGTWSFGGTAAAEAGAGFDLSQYANSLALPAGNTAARPTAISGMLRYNTQLNQVEAAISNTWTALGAGAGCTISGGAQYQIIVNSGSSGCSSDTAGSVNAGALSLGSSGTAGSVALGNATSGVITLQPVTGALGTVTASLPANTGTLAELNLAQTWSAVQTHNNGDLSLAGSSSGNTLLEATAVAGAGTVATFPANTGTVAELNLAQSWTAAQTFAAVNGGVNVQSGTTYTTAATDCGKTLLFTSNSAVTVTIAASIVPASGTACVISVLQGGTAKVSVNGSAVTPATLVSANSYTGTSGTAGAAIALILTTVSSTATAYLNGNGS